MSDSSSTETVPFPRPLPWYQSSQIRAALGLFIPALLAILRTTHLDKKLHIDLDAATTEQVKDIFIALLAAFSGVWWMLKRVKAGKRDWQVAEIIPPKVVTAVNRITQS